MSSAAASHVGGVRAVLRRQARGGTLVLGGGFGGAYVARSLRGRGATVVSPESSMLYTPLLAEVAAGAIEPRHVNVPLRMMCPHADLVVGRAVALDEGACRVVVETATGALEIGYEQLVVALGAVASWLPVPGLAEHGLGFKNLADAVHLRNHVLRRIEAAAADPAAAGRHLTFVFVGAGYAGVEALAELSDLVRDSLRYYPRLRAEAPRWVLVSRGPRILSEVPDSLGRYVARQLARRGVELRLSSTLASVEPDAVTLSDGSRLETGTVVWTAGTRPNPLVRELGLPLDARGRIAVDTTLRVEGRTNVWALGDCASVPNAATPGRNDPPTCQHALRQARRLARNLAGERTPYRYRMLGQGTTLGRDRGVANLLGVVNVRGLAGALFTRWYHLHQLPLVSRRLRVLSDGMLSILFGRDMAHLGLLERSSPEGPARADGLGA